MAKHPGRRTSARPRSVRIAAYVLLALGFVLVVAALFSPATRLEAASGGLFLIGGPLVFLGTVLMGLDWMASYTATAEGSWDHHARSAAGRAGARVAERSRIDSKLRSGRRRDKRQGLFAPSQMHSAFAASVLDDAGYVDSVVIDDWSAPHAALPPAPAPAFATVPAVAPAGVAQTALPPKAPAPRPVPALRAAPVVPAAVAPVAPVAPAALPVTRPSRPEPAPEPEAEDSPAYQGSMDPGPDTVIEEFVGYEGQDRMVVARSTVPPPRELAWPNPPRTAVDVSSSGNEAFLEKLMDGVLAKIGKPGTVPRTAALANADSGGGTITFAPTFAGATPAPSPPPPPPPPPSPPAPTWGVRTLHDADHWRFAALVEKLYQQAGFATQLQAGQSMSGVVVLWLFSRHRPGMPASVVSCVHTPGNSLAAEEIISVAELVKTRGLPRGQLATTAQVDPASQQLAATQRVHVMDTQRLLELINQRSVEQQRALAARLA